VPLKKVMLFKKALIDKILEGKKTMTSRNKKLRKEGAITNLMADKDYSKITGKYIKITKVYQKALGKFTDKDSKKEGFNTIEEFKTTWTSINGSWDPEQIVTIHEFVLVEKDNEKAIR
jgi:hypothetical protein